jgi:HSP20 family molecular chaperone IbpA
MSLLPLIVSLTDDHDYYDPWSGLSAWPLMTNLHQLQPRTSGGYRRNWGGNQVCPRRKEAMPVSTIGKDGFQVCVDVHQFAPNEISVKTLDNSVVIEGKHEEKQDDHGFVSRHFVRRYVLPKDYDVQQVVSTLSSDGVLTVKAPPPTPKEVQGRERVIQIQHTGPAHLSVKSNEAEGEKKAEAEGQK